MYDDDVFKDEETDLAATMEIWMILKIVCRAGVLLWSAVLARTLKMQGHLESLGSAAVDAML